MRSFFGYFLAVLAVLAVAVALPAAWFSIDVVEGRNLQPVARELAQTDLVRGKVQDLVASHIEAKLEEKAGGGGLVPIDDIADRIAADYVKSDGYPEDFAEALEKERAWLFDEPRDGAAPTLIVEPPISEAIRTLLDGIDAADTISVTIELPAVTDTATRDGFYNAGRYSGIAAVAAVIAALLFAVGAVALAVRRGRVLIVLGAGTALVGVGWWLFAANGAGTVTGWFRRAPEGVPLHDITGAILGGLVTDSVICLAVGAAVMVIGIGVALLESRMRARRSSGGAVRTPDPGQGGVPGTRPLDTAAPYPGAAAPSPGEGAPYPGRSAGPAPVNPAPVPPGPALGLPGSPGPQRSGPPGPFGQPGPAGPPGPFGPPGPAGPPPAPYRPPPGRPGPPQPPRGPHGSQGGPPGWPPGPPPNPPRPPGR